MSGEDRFTDFLQTVFFVLLMLCVARLAANRQTVHAPAEKEAETTETTETTEKAEKTEDTETDFIEEIEEARLRSFWDEEERWAAL